MKKGRELVLISGLLDIIFALGLIALIALSFVGGAYNYALALFAPFISIVTLFVDVMPAELYQILYYGLLALIGVFAIISLVFGSLTIAKIRKDDNKYYKSGAGLITAIIFEIIVLAILTTFLVYSANIITIMTVSILGLIVLFRFISLFVYYSLKKNHIDKTPKAK